MCLVRSQSLINSNSCIIPKLFLFDWKDHKYDSSLLVIQEPASMLYHLVVSFLVSHSALVFLIEDLIIFLEAFLFSLQKGTMSLLALYHHLILRIV